MKKYIVMDIGCIECGIGTNFEGIFDTPEEAEKRLESLDSTYSGWRDGGQTAPQVFTIEI